MRVLFLCTGNSCRSQMAEGWLRSLAPDSIVALSAGTKPQTVNPGAVRAMSACDVDIAAQSSKSIEEFVADPPELVITVCDAAAEVCPTLPGSVHVLHWPFDDPADATGTESEIVVVFERVRDEIRTRIEAWLAAGAPLDGAGI